MRQRWLAFGVAALALTPVLLGAAVAAQARVTSRQEALFRTTWGEPDLQGIWTDEHTTPFQRPAKYAGREFLTEAEVAELEKARAADRFSSVLASGDLLLRPLGVEGGEQDVARPDDSRLVSTKQTGQRTSLVIDPPDGRVPALTAEAQKMKATNREFQLALMQATDACKNQTPACAGGIYGPPSPRRADPAPYYNTGRLNRADGPEDRSLAERCMGANLPDFGGFRQIVQSPGYVSIFYDTGQGQGWHRVIPITSSPHLPPQVRHWWGDSRAHWEGETLVVDVTNFSPRTEYRGSREQLHLVERWRRTGSNTLEYVLKLDDPTVWTKSWTVRQELTAQSERANHIYKEPRCHEGNFGLIGLIVNMRAEEKAFADGAGPDPATKDNASNQGLGEEADSVGEG
jgi:hypothetical protein